MTRVADLMARTLVTLRESDDLTLADDILALSRFRHLPVVGERTNWWASLPIETSFGSSLNEPAVTGA